MPSKMRDSREEVGGSWFCINGHSLSYGETESKRLRRQLEQEQAETRLQRENFFAEQRRHENTKKAAKQAGKRSAAGVCPCCQRTFQQLSRHMQTKHKDFVKKHDIPAVEKKP
jgi:hypothetical protein